MLLRLRVQSSAHLTWASSSLYCTKFLCIAMAYLLRSRLESEYLTSKTPERRIFVLGIIQA